MKRREFITLFGGTVMTLPLRAQAQGRKLVRIGLVPLGSPENKYDQSLVTAFRQGLHLAGLTEDRDIMLDVVWPKGDPNRAVSEVLKRGAGVLIPCGSSASGAAK